MLEKLEKPESNCRYWAQVNETFKVLVSATGLGDRHEAEKYLQVAGIPCQATPQPCRPRAFRS